MHTDNGTVYILCKPSFEVIHLPHLRASLMFGIRFNIASNSAQLNVLLFCGWELDRATSQSLQVQWDIDGASRSSTWGIGCYGKAGIVSVDSCS